MQAFVMKWLALLFRSWPSQLPIVLIQMFRFGGLYSTLNAV